MDFKSFLEFQWNAICQVIAWNDKESWIKMNSFFVVYMMRVCLLGNLGLLFSHKKKRWSSHKPHLFFSFSAYLIPKAPTPSPEPIQPQLLARPRLRLTMNTAPAKPMSINPRRVKRAVPVPPAFGRDAPRSFVMVMAITSSSAVTLSPWTVTFVVLTLELSSSGFRSTHSCRFWYLLLLVCLLQRILHAGK